MNATRHPPLTAAYILTRLRVDVKTGRCYWIAPPKNHAGLLGKEAGCPRRASNKFYWVIRIDGLSYLRGQIIFAVKYGYWPLPCLDHKNGDSLNDNWRNLRIATRLQNAQNRKTGRLGRVLPMGVRRSNSKFKARIRVNTKLIDLGSYATINKAVAVYRKARNHYFGEWA